MNVSSNVPHALQKNIMRVRHIVLVYMFFVILTKTDIISLNGIQHFVFQ